MMEAATTKISRMSTCAVVCLLMLALMMNAVKEDAEAAGTRVGFYRTTCPNAEAIIARVVRARFARNPTITAALLRMFFHDCFVQGCDASILLDSTPGNSAEKEAGPNLTVREFDLIDQIKAALEKACPGTVSCADIIAYATRDSVALAGGPRYAVGGGRFDGKVSRAQDVNLPGPTFSVDQASATFAQRGLSLTDMVALLGAHTTGFAHCFFFSDRLSNFQGTGKPDPAMNPRLVPRLSRQCAASPSTVVALDQGTRDRFDASFFTQLRLRNGVLQIDQALTAHPRASRLVNAFTSPRVFFPTFARSILKMGNIGIKAPPAGEVRLNCRRVN